jgi:tRNA(fMet)-specific endonuclease VapC
MFCLDTNIVIFAMNGRRPGIGERLDAEIAAGTKRIVPAIVLFELDFGVAKSDRREKAGALLDEFLSAGFEHPTFDAEDASEAADIRAFLEQCGTPIGPFDYLVAAQARRPGVTMVTTNTREFGRVPGLQVADWTA